jgi:hypothetical protein
MDAGVGYKTFDKADILRRGVSSKGDPDLADAKAHQGTLANTNGVSSGLVFCYLLL